MPALPRPRRRPWLGLLFGWVCYFLAIRSLFYLIGFLGDFGVGKTVDRPLGVGAVAAWISNVVLLLQFVVPHSLLARPGLRAELLGWVPGWAERSVYVLLSALSLVLLVAYWQPLPALVWDVRGTAWLAIALWVLFGLAWALAFVASWTLGHFQLFGLAPAVARWRGQEPAPRQLVTRGVYRWVRHPMYLGFVVALWATPAMSQGRLLLALALTVYVEVGVRLEERELLERFGDAYRRYQAAVPGAFGGERRPPTAC